jgi:outer membrane protein TolC
MGKGTAMGASRNTVQNFMIRCVMLWAALIWICSAPTADAVEEHLDLSDGISAQEAVMLAIRENYGLRALSKAREAALGEVSRAQAFSEPEIRMGASGLDDSRISSQGHDYDIMLHWSPPRFGERGLKTRLAMGKAYEMESEISAAQNKLACDVLFLHSQIVFLDEKIALAEAAMKVRENILEFVDSQVKAELKTLLDRNVADLALADARMIPETYRAQRLLCFYRLAGELNLSVADLKIRKEGDAFVLKPRLLDLGALIDAAMGNRSELSIASTRIAEAETSLSLSKKERYPWFSFFQTGPEFDAGNASHSWKFRVGIDLPIFKWNSGVLRGPVAEVQRSQMNLADQKRQVRMEVEQTAAQLRARYGVVEQFDKTIAPILARDIALAEESVNLGQMDRLQYLLAKVQGIQRQQAYLTDLLECRRLEIELDRITGSVFPGKSKGDMK